MVGRGRRQRFEQVVDRHEGAPRRRQASAVLYRAIASSHGATGEPSGQVCRLRWIAGRTSCTRGAAYHAGDSGSIAPAQLAVAAREAPDALRPDLHASLRVFVSPGAWATHGLWAACFLARIACGPGRLSLDRLLGIDR